MSSSFQFVQQLFSDVSETKLSEILGAGRSDEFDVESAVEVVLAALNESEPENDELETLCTIFPNTTKQIVRIVLAKCDNNMAEAAEKLALIESGQLNLTELDLNNDSIRLANGNLVGRDHDVETIMSMFPAFSVDAAKSILESQGGLHNTIHFLTGNEPASPRQMKGKGRTSYLRASTSFSKIVSDSAASNNSSPVFDDTQDSWSPSSRAATATDKRNSRISYRISSISSLNPHITTGPTTTTALNSDSDSCIPTSPFTSEYCRAEAARFSSLRAETFQTAAREFKRGSLTGRGGAQYYSELGHKYSKSVALWNARAAQCIQQENEEKHRGDGSVVVDLHGLTRREALDVLSVKLDEYFGINSSIGKYVDGDDVDHHMDSTRRRSSVKKKKKPPLKVITGMGAHSGNRKPVILPAVLGFLKKAGWKFEHFEENIGYIEVSGI